VWRYEVGVSVVEHDEPSLRERLADLGADEATDLLEHVYRFRGSVIEMLDDAKMWNHAADPTQETIRMKSLVQAMACHRTRGGTLPLAKS
jgi:methionine synthase II (cobalamin-independent)